MENIFEQKTVDSLLERIDKLSTSTQPQWGKMTAGQMLAHCNVTYEMVYTHKHPKPNGFMKFILKLLVKNKVVSEKPYTKNLKTAPQFIIDGQRDFEQEKQRLQDYIKQTADLGEAHFEGKESHSFGPLRSNEWNNMFYKHLNHHLTQFSV